MAYQFVTPRYKAQAINLNSPTQLHGLGEIQQANDPLLFGGEFIYLKGVASTVIGSPVTWNAAMQTALAPVGTNLPQSVAFAMAPTVAGQFGWYQIAGVAVGAKVTTLSLAAGAAIGVKTVGLVNSTGTGKEIQGALVATAVTAASASGTVQILLNRPHFQGRIT